MAALVGFTAATTSPKDAGCMNWDAFYYISDDQYCNEVWQEWDV